MILFRPAHYGRSPIVVSLSWYSRNIFIEQFLNDIARDVRHLITIGIAEVARFDLLDQILKYRCQFCLQLWTNSFFFCSSSSHFFAFCFQLLSTTFLVCAWCLALWFLLWEHLVPDVLNVCLSRLVTRCGFD